MFNSPRTVFCDVYYLTPECKTPAGCRYQFTLFFSTPQLLLAIAAPSRRARSLDQVICGWTRPPRPGAGDEVFLADDFSERDDANSSVCSTRSMAWLTTPTVLRV